MDAVAKEFHCNVNLGETFWTAVVQQQFASKLSQHPLVRTALLMANLTSDKKEDGIAKLLVKGDVARVAGKSKEQKCGEAEAALSDAMQIKDSVIDAGNAKEEDLLKALGQFFVRVALMLAGKGKAGRECKEYTLDEAKQAYIKTISEAMGISGLLTVNLPGWIFAEGGYT